MKLSAESARMHSVADSGRADGPESGDRAGGPGAKRYQVEMIGVSADAIRRAEDRNEFNAMQKRGWSARSSSCIRSMRPFSCGNDWQLALIIRGRFTLRWYRWWHRP